MSVAASNYSLAEQFSSPEPTKSAKVPFNPPGSGTGYYETAYFLYGDLSSISKRNVPLICLHGGPGVPHHLLKRLGLLNKLYSIPVLLYDQIGCGASSHLPEKKGDTSFWTFNLFINELNNLVKSLQIKEYDIFGSSWGGMLATQFALTQPRGMRRLIIASAPASLAARVAVSMRQLAEIPGNAKEVFDQCMREGKTESPEFMQVTMEYYKRHLCRLDPFPQDLIDAMNESRKDDTVSSTMYAGSLVPTGSLKDYDCVDQLHRITKDTAPGGVLVSVLRCLSNVLKQILNLLSIMNGAEEGAQDEVMRPYYTAIRAQVKWVKFAKSSHVPFLEETEKFINAVGGFLTCGR